MTRQYLEREKERKEDKDGGYIRNYVGNTKAELDEATGNPEWGRPCLSNTHQIVLLQTECHIIRVWYHQEDTNILDNQRLKICTYHEYEDNLSD